MGMTTNKTKKFVIRNFTPHTINIVDGQTFKSEGVARVECTFEQVYNINGIPVYKSVYGDVTGLPIPVPGTVLIVSRMIIQELPERNDLFSPSQLVRNEKGQPIGCKGLGE